MDLKDKRIVVTGGTGFLGSSLCPAMRAAGYREVSVLSHKDYDLLEQAAVRKMYADLQPQVVIHLAALIGGIAANKAQPADFYYRNALMTMLVMHEASVRGVTKFMTCIGGCSYPGKAPSPIKEESMWDGYPQLEHAPYSIAKKAAIVQAGAYRQQYGLNAIVLIPGNMYGPYDNYHLHDAHVVAALIRKVYEAKRRGDQVIPAWGTGRPVRDFVYVKDVVAVLLVALEQYNEPEVINISSGVQTTIKELYELVVELCGFTGKIAWDPSQPDGQMYKGFDVTRMKTILKSECATTLRDGLRETITWFGENYDQPGKVRL